MAGLSVKNVEEASTPTKVGTSSINLLVGLRRKFFREMKIFAQREFRRTKRTIKDSKGSVTIVGRRVIWKRTIVNSGYANHMIGDKQKLQNLSVYKGSRVVVTANDSRLPITHTGKTAVSLQHGTNQIFVAHEIGSRELFQANCDDEAVNDQGSSLA
ncbi:hypothetical protein H5410_017594 [Solanum commersonii]|uniref:Polyprotein n=1 Tax=Solanum commersonii TaxID=4109 RepID=A0A9J6A0G2_SOLCO|nr:hypothetical protein H5410_017594 [Solanum commersonii]